MSFVLKSDSSPKESQFISSFVVQGNLRAENLNIQLSSPPKKWAPQQVPLTHWININFQISIPPCCVVWLVCGLKRVAKKSFKLTLPIPKSCSMQQQTLPVIDKFLCLQNELVSTATPTSRKWFTERICSAAGSQQSQLQSHTHIDSMLEQQHKMLYNVAKFHISSSYFFPHQQQKSEQNCISSLLSLLILRIVCISSTTSNQLACCCEFVVSE